MHAVRALTDMYTSLKRPSQLNWSFGIDPCGQPDCRFRNIQASIIDDTGRLPRCNWQGIECKDWNIAIMCVVLEVMVSMVEHSTTPCHSNLACIPPAPQMACQQPLQGQLPESIGNLTNLLAMCVAILLLSCGWLPPDDTCP